LGIKTGVDLDKLVTTGEWISEQLKRHNGSKVGQALGGNC
jgi:hydroxymethylglutaryl-CoA lyase